LHPPDFNAERLAGLAASTGLGAASIVVEPLDRTAAAQSVRAALAAEAAIYPASMIKLPIAMAVAAQCAAGERRWSDTMIVDDAAMTSNDAPSPLLPGYAASIAELVHGMIAASDNVATNVLIDVLGRETITLACRGFGVTQTIVARKVSGSLPLIDDPAATGRNAHPACDAASLFLRVARDGGQATAEVWNALAAQIWNDKLSAGLEPGDSFAHKTGDTSDVSHDGGILTLANGRRFVLVVYTQLGSNPETDARFAAFMRALRPYLAGTVQDRSLRSR